MKDIADDWSLMGEAEEAEVDDLKQGQTDGLAPNECSVMTVCDNFITIYGYSTWKKKFGR